jgi:hypothetical protein
MAAISVRGHQSNRLAREVLHSVVVDVGGLEAAVAREPLSGHHVS